LYIRFTWDEGKRRSNLKDHGFDFLDALRVFEGLTFTLEDDRFDYGEQRFVTLGFLGGVAVSLVHTETTERIHVISFAGQLEMKKRSSLSASKTDWKRIRAMKDRDIRLSDDHPEAALRNIVRGIVRRGLKPVPPKTSIALRLDADVLAWFKAQGPRYQTRMNAVLRAFKDASL
jgi:uncharacterized protein (DUF4415 family)